MQRLLTYILVAMMATFAYAQPTRTVKKRLGTYFANYENSAYTCRDKAKVEKLLFRSQSKEVEIAVSEIFLGQPFTNEQIGRAHV